MRKQMIKKLVETVKKVAGDGLVVQIWEVEKNNGVEKCAITISESDDRIAPVIYVDGIIDDIENGDKEMREAAELIVNSYMDIKDKGHSFDVSEYQRKGFILGHVGFQMVNAERNEKMLEKTPHRKIMDLAAIYRVVINAESSFVLYEGMMKMVGITEEELYLNAVRNTGGSGFEVRTLGEMLGLPDFECGLKMYCITNKNKMFGANAILFKAEFEKVAKKADDDLYILPSSIHELLAVSASQLDLQELKTMVRDVNNTKVSPEEILGYSIYRYDRKSEEIKIVA